MKCSRIIPLPPVFDERVPQTWNIWVIANLKVDDLCQNFFIIQDAWKNWTVYYSTKSFYESDQLELDRLYSSLLLYMSVNTWIAISVVISIIGRFMWSFLGKKGHDLDWNINKKKFSILEKEAPHNGQDMSSYLRHDLINFRFWWCHSRKYLYDVIKKIILGEPWQSKPHYISLPSLPFPKYYQILLAVQSWNCSDKNTENMEKMYCLDVLAWRWLGP